MKKQPVATYRLQLNSKFTFYDLIEILDYLKGLGISHVYLSPCLKAAPGSEHCYDVINHAQINEELGGMQGFERLVKELEMREMGAILDIVPNHMAIGGQQNPWWWDVLENGSSSVYASYFDVEWHYEPDNRMNLILVPVLGDHYGIVLENMEFELKHNAGSFSLKYHEHSFPVAPRSLANLLEQAADRINSSRLAFIGNSFRNLVHPSSKDLQKVSHRQRDKLIIKNLLEELCACQPEIVKAIDEVIQEINNDADKMDNIIGQQNYRLAYWKISQYKMGYRRFFNINTLAGVCMEDIRVFNDSHKLLVELYNKNMIDGFRIDHPDGLYDPTNYFFRLKKRCPQAYIFAEKILEHDEVLPSSWPISGTTGYDFLNLANGFFVSKDGYDTMVKNWKAFTKDDRDYEQLVYEKKQYIVSNLLGSEVSRLAADLSDICEKHRRHRDFANLQLYNAIAEVAVGMSIYRTYINPETGKVSRSEESRIKTAISKAKENRQDLGEYVFEFIADILLLRLRGEEESRFIMRFQQLTGPVMAKSIEDTLFYNYVPLISVNEVGGNPHDPAVDPKKFHEWCVRINSKWPETMLGSSTHDTKRSEDVRARLNALSHMPDKFNAALKRWYKHNKKHKKFNLPDRNTEYMLYQTLVGAWPISLERTKNFMTKAVREAKVYSNWADPDKEYETILMNYIELLYADTEFMGMIEDFVETIKRPGFLNSIAQLILKLTAPGIPDIYQGNEFWDYSLTDPDNRRPVDFDKAKEAFKKMSRLEPETVMFDLERDLCKSFVIQKILDLRKRHHLFNEPYNYKSIDITGEYNKYALAFMRGDKILIIVSSMSLKPGSQWKNTKVAFPEGRWKNIFTGKTLSGGYNKLNSFMGSFAGAVFENQNA